MFNGWSGRVISARAAHPEKALAPISVTLSGIVRDLSAEQLLNALALIVIMPSGKFMLLRLEQ